MKYYDRLLTRSDIDANNMNELEKQHSKINMLTPSSPTGSAGFTSDRVLLLYYRPSWGTKRFHSPTLS